MNVYVYDNVNIERFVISTDKASGDGVTLVAILHHADRLERSEYELVNPRYTMLPDLGRIYGVLCCLESADLDTALPALIDYSEAEDALEGRVPDRFQLCD